MPVRHNNVMSHEGMLHVAVRNNHVQALLRITVVEVQQL
jgi:hypothetical protein